VVIDPATDVPAERFKVGSVVHLDDGTALTVSRYEATDRSPLVTFEEVAGRDAAQQLRGREIFIPSSERRPLETDEYWPDDLIGMVVSAVDGTVIGPVTDVETDLVQDRLIVASSQGEVIVPLVAPLVQSVDTDRGTVVVDLPAGFIE
jgi:16S rRNA processing protein RimM